MLLFSRKNMKLQNNIMLQKWGSAMRHTNDDSKFQALSKLA